MTVREWVETHFAVERWRNDEADIKCRLHDDAHASASINVERRLWKCMACGAGGTLTDLAGELGIEPPAYGGNGQGRYEVARYDYVDAGGKVVYQVVRFEPGKRGEKKDFAQFDAVAGEWGLKNMKQRVPYRLPELLAGIKAGRTVFVVEGEKDVETLRRLKLVATCNQGGVGSGSLWKGFAAKYFTADSSVVLIPDADLPGRALMAEVGGYLAAAGCTVKVLDLGFAVAEEGGRRQGHDRPPDGPGARDVRLRADHTGALSFLKGWEGVLTRSDAWDADPWALNCDNGIIDLRTGELGEHDPERLLTKIAPAAFEPDAPGPTWRAHLERCLPEEAVRRQVQRDLGLALIGADVEEMLPIWYGTGANGKTTTAKVLRRVLGDYLAEAAPGLLIQTKYERHPTELADLAGRRLVFSSEVAQGKRLDEEVVKRLPGGDTKKARYMGADFFEFEQSFSIFLIVNHHPGITGTDTAIWRRVRLIPWTVQIPEAERLPQDVVVERLAGEGPAVLSWLLAGLADWRAERGWTAPEVKAATAAYRAEQDRLGGFLAECCEEAAHYTVPVADLYEADSAWSAETGEDPLRKTTFGRRLRENGKTTYRDGHDNVTKWLGVRLRRHATSTSSSPLGNPSMPDKQESDVATRRNGDEWATVDTETLETEARRLADYLDDETIPVELRGKKQPAYEAVLAELAWREVLT